MKAMSAGMPRPRVPSVAEERTSTVSVNMLCIIGGTIGIFSLFLPWYWTGEGTFALGTSVYDALLAPRDYDYVWIEHLVSISQVLFVTGTILAFAIPAACSVQAIGLILFYTEIVDFGPLYSYDLGLSAGFFIAILSFAVVSAGLIMPHGFGFDKSQTRWSRRAETASRTRLGNCGEQRQSFASPLDVARGIWKHRRWGAALLAVIILLSVLLYVDEADKESAGSVERVDGRIVVTIGDSAIYGFWAGRTLSVSDGSDTAEWELESNLTLLHEEGVWIPPILEAKNISEMAVVPTIVDYGGEGRISCADQIILTPQNATSFLDDVEYRVNILEVIYALDVPLTHLYVFFETDGDSIDYDFEIVSTQGMLRPVNYTVWPTYISVAILVVSSTVLYNMLLTELRRFRSRVSHR